MRTSPSLLAVCFLASGCASTTVSFSPAPPPSALCGMVGERSVALVLWQPRWRADQKEVPKREAAAAQGIARYFASSGCFARAEVRRIAPGEASGPEDLRRHAVSIEPKPGLAVLITVRELGPVLRLLSSAALIDGGTEVVLDLAAYRLDGADPPQVFTVHWQNGGPGVVKGVATLADDMEAALAAGFKVSAGAR